MITSEPREVEFDTMYNRQSSLFNGDISDHESGISTLSLRTDHFSATSMGSGSQFKVSEIVNPDGSVTVRNLLIRDDGSWTKHEEDVKDRRTSKSTLQRRVVARDSNYVENDARSSSDSIPSMKQANSFDSTSASSSSSGEYRRRRGNRQRKFTEASAHRLRRQRFAQSSLLTGSPLHLSARNRSCSPKRSPPFGDMRPSPSRSLKSFRGHQPYESSSNLRTSSLSPKRSTSHSNPQHIERSIINSPLSIPSAVTAVRSNATAPRPRIPKYSSPKTVSSAPSRTLQIPNGRRRKEQINISPRTTSSAPSRRIYRPNNRETNEWSSNTPKTYASNKSQHRSNPRSRDKRVAFTEPVKPKRRHRNAPTPSDDATIAFGYYGCWPVGSPEMENGSNAQIRGSTKEYDDPPVFANDMKTGNAFVPKTSSTSQQNPLHHSRNLISYLDEEERVPAVRSVTVRKASREDRIGLFVHLGRFSFGNRLVVTKIDPKGKFANSGIEKGDFVISINGVNMLNNPETNRALAIVGAASDTVTVIVEKGCEEDDGQSAAQTSVSSISKSVSSTLDDKIDQVPSNHGERKVEKFTGKASKMKEVEKMTSDGSMLISKDTELETPLPITAKESWKLSGALVVCIEKSHDFEKPGIRVGKKENVDGHCLYITGIDSSSPFAKTPLRTGDVILAINNVSLHRNTNVVDAYSALGKSGKRITLVAKKGNESLTDFLRSRKKQAEAYKGDGSVFGQSMGSLMTSDTIGTVGTTISGDSKPNVPKQRVVSNVERGIKREGKSGEDTTGSSFTGSDDGQDAANISNDGPNVSRSTALFEFDEESYGASIVGYNSSSSVKLIKKNQNENIGFEVQEVDTEWGRILAVSKIEPRSLASESDLKVGDAILAINGVSFRQNPSATRASALARSSKREVCVEYQKLSSFSPAVPIDVKISECQEKSMNAPIFNSELFLAGNHTDYTSSEKSNHSVSCEEEVGNAVGDDDVKKEQTVSSGNSAAKGDQREPDFSAKASMIPPKRPRLRIIVTKQYEEQEVGINIAETNSMLIVTGLTSTGMLRKAPLAYGDIIQSINGIDFRTVPDAKEAIKVINGAPKKVTFEILKTTPVPAEFKAMDGVSNKSCVRIPFVCSRRSK